MEAQTHLTPGATFGRPAQPWREDSAGFGDRCLAEAGGGEKVGLGRLGWEMLVAPRAWSLSPTPLCREACRHQGGADFWKNIAETKQWIHKENDNYIHCPGAPGVKPQMNKVQSQTAVWSPCTYCVLGAVGGAGDSEATRPGPQRGRLAWGEVVKAANHHRANQKQVS